MVRVGTGSPLAGVALARLGIEVAYPDKDDVESGLKGVAETLIAFRKYVERDSRAAAQQKIQDAQNTLKRLGDVTNKSMQESNNFELAHQKRFANDSMRTFAAATDEASMLAKRAIITPDLGMSYKNTGIDALSEGVPELTGEFEQLQRVTWNYYNMGHKAQEQVKRDLTAHLEGLRDVRAELAVQIKEKAREEAMYRELAGGDKESLYYSFAEMWEAEIAKLVVRKEEIEGNIAATSSLVDHIKRADEATKAGAKNRKQAIREATQSLAAMKKAVVENDEAIRKWAYEAVKPAAMALNNFKSVLKESVMALTIFYYKISEATSALMSFQQELMNAQSIFQTSSETLFTLSDQIVRFGTEFGVSYDNAAKGLYQFASAGLSAEDSLALLNDTLKLSMAVQGDHNTISKLTTQVIYGFGLSMDDATDVTDKFAHAINKSLIEYQDLASAIKFSMPFFVSSGQSLETLLGALQVLTNRALEAGIAGRGLRQALAEFTQHADDNAAGFRKLGIEILDTENNMRDLTDIAQQFNATLGEQTTDMEIMMTLMEDLNIRGATAFVHLVQNADEFTAAVDDLANSSGAAAEMAAIQQEGLLMQIQRLKNLFAAPFLLSENMARDVGELNRLTIAMKYVVDGLSDIVVEGEGADAVLTDTGVYLREVLITAVVEFGNALQRIVEVAQEWSEAGLVNINIIKLYFLPLTALIWVVDNIGANLGRLLLTLYVLNRTIPIATITTKAYAAAMWLAAGNIKIMTLGSLAWRKDAYYLVIANTAVTISFYELSAALLGIVMGFVLGYKLAKKVGDHFGPLVGLFVGVAVAALAMWAAISWGANLGPTLKAFAIGTAAAIAVGSIAYGLMAATAPAEADIPELDAYMAQMDQPNFTSGTKKGSTENLYVRKLVYTDSNQAEYMQTQTATQAGGVQ